MMLLSDRTERIEAHTSPHVSDLVALQRRRRRCCCWWPRRPRAAAADDHTIVVAVVACVEIFAVVAAVAAAAAAAAGVTVRWAQVERETALGLVGVVGGAAGCLALELGIDANQVGEVRLDVVGLARRRRL